MQAVSEAAELNSKFNFFNTISPKVVGKGRLSGFVLAVKDNICIEGIETTAGSAILKGYLPVFTATAVQRLLAEGAMFIGKTAMDEFGFGSFGINCGLGFKPARNPNWPDRVCGGSSSGSAGWVRASRFRAISLCSSTGGSIVNPAAFCNVVGLCPTYGRVSRYGLIDYASSLDKIGVIAKCVEDAALVLELAAGPDSFDATCPDIEIGKLSRAKPRADVKIGLLKFDVQSSVQAAFQTALSCLEEAGAQLVQLQFPIDFKAVLAAYYIIALAEASTNLAKYCGLRYGSAPKLKGSYNAYFSSVRASLLGPEAKRRIILGTFARSAGWRERYYTKACQVRSALISAYREIFQKVDLLASPTMPFQPPKFSEIAKLSPLQHYMSDIITVPPNLAGLPHLSIPCGPGVGLMLTANQFEELQLIQLGLAAQNAIKNRT